MATCIPNHTASECRNIGTRLDIFDQLMESGIWRGTQDEIVSRFKAMRNGDLLAREYEHYIRNGNCCTCFWRMVYDNMPLSKSVVVDKLKHIYYAEIVTSLDKLEEEQSIQRFVKQTTEPITDYLYIIEECNDYENYDTKIRIGYKTESEHKPKSRLFERLFPEDSLLHLKIPMNAERLRYITTHPDAVKKGNW